MRTLLLTVSTVLSVACASEKYVRVSDVHLLGAKGIDKKELTAGLATHDPTGFFLFRKYAEYDEVSVARDRQRIESYYQRHGYFSARVTDVQTRPVGDKKVEVTFKIEEGDPTRIVSVTLNGMPPLPDADAPLDDMVLVKKGDVYKDQNYVDTKRNLRAILVRQGYAHATANGSVEVDRDRREAAVRIDVDPGPMAQFGDVKVNGLVRLPESAVLNRVAWEKGDRFDPRRVRDTRGRLYQLGFLSSVNISFPREERPALLPMTIEVKEGLRHELKLGGGAVLDNANVIVRPRFGYMVRGFVDPLLTLAFDARPGFIVAGQGSAGQLAGEVRGSLTRDDLFYPRVRGVLSVSAEVTELETYAARALNGRVGFDRPFLDDHLLVGVAYQLRLFDFAGISGALTPEDRMRVGLPTDEEAAGFGLNYRLGAFEQTIAFDYRDYPLDAQNGSYFELRLEESGAYSGSSFAYVKATPEVRGYYSPWTWLVFAGKARFGTTLSGEPPITQRYFSGGASSHRGFTFRRLSPMSSGTDDDGGRVPIGGSTLLETSAEVRVDLFPFLGNWVGLVAFLDGGDVTLARSDLDLTNLHWATGLGLRYNTIVGPIRFDVGFRLNRFGETDPDPGKRFALHLSLGEAF